jgi:hypothetical protein
VAAEDLASNDVDEETLTSNYEETVLCKGPSLVDRASESSDITGVLPSESTVRGAPSSSSSSASYASVSAMPSSGAPLEAMHAFVPASNIENDVLSTQQSKVGDVYRLLKNSQNMRTNDPGSKGSTKSSDKNKKGQFGPGRNLTNDNSDIENSFASRGTKAGNSNAEVRRFCRIQHDFDII